MQNSRNYDELLDVWLRWRDAVGPQMRRSYARLVSLLNHVARSSGYSDQAEVWKELFDIPDLRSYVEQKWQRLRPLYLQLHAYARSKLRHLYGKNKVSEKGPIPAHILGNMWAQDWSSLYSLLAPYPGVELPDISSELQGQEYTADRIFHTAEDFYTSIGLEPMTKTFWKRSMLQKPAGRDVMCHGSAFNMHDWRGEDFRIKMCTEIDSSHFSTAHHEMGHIEYYMMYGDQPDLYQEGANPAFHEAVGDTILLSVSTPQHQSIIGLAAPSSHADNYEFQINYLMKMALRTVAFLPFGLLVDLWRWDVFEGVVTEEEWNEHWWNLREQYQGVRPPTARHSTDFDPGSKYHIPLNSKYISYFLSYQLQFQFHKALCAAAGHQGPLHTCDIYNSRASGDTMSFLAFVGVGCDSAAVDRGRTS
ncbi:PREDICTED: angiotensin-converting enzyme-like isoform X2 [Priapulus caudatus]|uniref:Angiotensin-converting enzyme n=1 Tax=Priapulus caudatus TaxID=37621 RepID=A0ABM1DRW0_PRICU|nr:PREDICTED: angiotensin-converting enzyme-like isoform X2 [Priapulus caudatus]